VRGGCRTFQVSARCKNLHPCLSDLSLNFRLPISNCSGRLRRLKRNQQKGGG
jgi:hypothetical protein